MGEGDGCHSPTVEDHYRKLYFEVLDLAISSTTQLTCKLLLTFMVMTSTRVSFQHNCKSSVQAFPGMNKARSSLYEKFYIFCEVSLKVKGFFYKQACWIARLILVLPSTNAASEISFSAMKRVKTYLCSTMSQPRLNHIMTLNI